MYRTTVVNLTPDASHAQPDGGPRYLAELSRREVGVLLEKFREIDESENAKADPEIVLETRRQKHIVRTAQGRLHLYDARDPLSPAHVLTVEEVLSEIDGSALAARTRAPFPLPEATPATPVTSVPVSRPPSAAALRPPQRITLGLVALASAGYLIFGLFFGDADSPADGFIPVTDELAGGRFRAELSGVYMTGPRPGDHGIALTTDGNLKLFQNNAQGAPSLIRDTYRIGHVGTQLSARGTETKVTLRFEGSTRLTSGGETYLRLP